MVARAAMMALYSKGVYVAIRSFRDEGTSAANGSGRGGAIARLEELPVYTTYQQSLFLDV